MTALTSSLDFPLITQWKSALKSLLKPASPARLQQTGGWPWFGSAAIDEDLMPWGRSCQTPRHPKGPHPMPEDPRDPQLPFGSSYHTPVLLREIITALQPSPGMLILDGTLGGGGHSEALLQAGAQVVGMDQDPQALAFAGKRLSSYGTRFCALRGNFRQFPEILNEVGIKGLDGILLDLGVSSHQLDDAARGFSFQKDGPLDLRMDPTSGQSAADLIATASAEQLADIFRSLGEEPRAWQIAQAIVKTRTHSPITGTKALADLVSKNIPGYSKRHPATKVFQALRLAVNDELGALQEFLSLAPFWLKPQGRLAIITFHSLEDRIVKQTFQKLSSPTLDRPEWPAPRPNPDHLLRLPSRKPIDPTAEEITLNPRARSARLRIAERLPHV